MKNLKDLNISFKSIVKNCQTIGDIKRLEEQVKKFNSPCNNNEVSISELKEKGITVGQSNQNPRNIRKTAVRTDRFTK